MTPFIKPQTYEKWKKKSFKSFFTRGKNNVKTEFIMLCFGYNINKLHAKIQCEKCVTHIHMMKNVA